MHRIRVGVIRGGPSNEYDNSIKTGSIVLNNLSQEKYSLRDIFIDKNGQWNMHGLSVLPYDVLNHIDIVFNSLHGDYGEDGKIQHVLESHGIPFTGSGSFSSMIGMNRLLTKDIYKKYNIKSPRFKLIDIMHNIKEIVLNIFHSFPLPVIIKPAISNNDLGITIVKDFDSIENAVNFARKYHDKIFVEEYIIGKEASVGIIDNFREQDYYALPAFGELNFDEKKDIEKLAIDAHKALGLRHYSNSNFIIHPRRGAFIIDTNVLPKFHDNTPIRHSMERVGVSVSHFLDHIIELALSKK